MTADVAPAETWWGSYQLGFETSRIWTIGPLTLIVRCLNNEWQIGQERKTDNLVNSDLCETRITDQLPDILAKNSRYVFHQTSGLLTLLPLMADRPIITRPQIPFYLTAGEEVTVYVSSSLWLELWVGASPRKSLERIAIQRPSDTWFGPSTRSGELCYASTTHCRLSLKDQPHRPHRAITPVLIRNQADTTLAVERLNMPAPSLPIYASASGQLWTPKITLTRDKDGDMAALKIDKKAPKEAESALRISEPLNKIENGLLFRAFNAVFS